jgi:hypothetical protein
MFSCQTLPLRVQMHMTCFVFYCKIFIFGALSIHLREMEDLFLRMRPCRLLNIESLLCNSIQRLARSTNNLSSRVVRGSTNQSLQGGHYHLLHCCVRANFVTTPIYFRNKALLILIVTGWCLISHRLCASNNSVNKM